MSSTANDSNRRRAPRSPWWFVGIGLGGTAAALWVGHARWTAPTPAPMPSAVPSLDAPAPTPAQGTPGSDWLRQYAATSNEQERHRLVLEQVARGNMPDTWDDWVTITVKGRKGNVVEFEVSPHGLRIGTTLDWVEVPLDGPHFAAVAQLLDVRLATAWMVDETYQTAKKQGALVHYFDASEIAQSLGYADWKPNAPDGEKMKSPEFIGRRSLLIRNWLEEHHVADGTLVAGYFKCVVPPVDGLTRSGGLEMLGGHLVGGELVQPLSGGFHPARFFDYSHNVRLARDEVRVNGQSLTLAEFWNSVPYAIEFFFRRSAVPHPAYQYPEDLARWMRERGHSPPE